jgi:hypothetical protein
MNLFGQPSRFVLISTCRSVNVTSVVITRFFFRPRPLPLRFVSQKCMFVITYYYGILLVLLAIDFTHPPPILCHMKFVQRGFTERAAVGGVSLTLVEGLLCNSELAVLWTYPVKVIDIDVQFLSCFHLCFPFFLYLLTYFHP